MYGTDKMVSRIRRGSIPDNTAFSEFYPGILPTRLVSMDVRSESSPIVAPHDGRGILRAGGNLPIHCKSEEILED